MQFTRTKPEFSKLMPDFKLGYPETMEGEDPGYPLAFDPVMETTILVDSDRENVQKRLVALSPARLPSFEVL